MEEGAQALPTTSEREHQQQTREGGDAPDGEILFDGGSADSADAEAGGEVGAYADAAADADADKEAGGEAGADADADASGEGGRRGGWKTTTGRLLRRTVFLPSFSSWGGVWVSWKSDEQ